MHLQRKSLLNGSSVVAQIEGLLPSKLAAASTATDADADSADDDTADDDDAAVLSLLLSFGGEKVDQRSRVKAFTSNRKTIEFCGKNSQQLSAERK